jgi:actin-related protein
MEWVRMENINFNDIKIQYTTERIFVNKNDRLREEKSFYYFEYYISNWRGDKIKSKLSYYEMHQMIISMGAIKIKNLFNKTYDMISDRYVYFKTKEDIELAYEWLKQKCMEVTLIGADNLRKSEENKRKENRAKREAKEIKDANKAAEENIANFKNHIGKTVNIPVNFGKSKLQVPVVLLNLSFNEKLNYILETSLGKIEFFYKDVTFVGNRIVSRNRPNGNPSVPIYGSLDIKY